MKQKEGWIKLSRKIEQTIFWDDSQVLMVWIWLLVNAAYEPTKMLVGKQIVSLQRGEFAYSRITASKELKLSPSKLFRTAQLFESEQQIEQQGFPRYTLVKILNYDYYQAGEQQFGCLVNSKRTANEQQMGGKRGREIEILESKEEEKTNSFPSVKSIVQKKVGGVETDKQTQLTKIHENITFYQHKYPFVDVRATLKALEESKYLKGYKDIEQAYNNWLRRSHEALPPHENDLLEGEFEILVYRNKDGKNIKAKLKIIRQEMAEGKIVYDEHYRNYRYTYKD